MEKTLVFIKPDAVAKDVWRDILVRYSSEGLVMIRSKILQMTEDLAKEFYVEHEGQPYFTELIAHMTSGPIIALEFLGADILERVRKLHGATNPAEAAEGTIRKLYGEPVRGPKNAVHGSDSAENAERELFLVFGKED